MAGRGRIGTGLLLGTAAVAALLLAQPGPAAHAQGLDTGRAALEARVLELEEELRRVNGRVEELEYEQRRLAERLGRLVGDVDQRLSAVEDEGRPPQRIVGSDEGGPPVPAEPAEPAAPAAPPEGGDGVPRRAPVAPPPAQAQARAPVIDPDDPPVRGNVLGTIPREAGRTGGTVAGLPPAGEATGGYDGALDLLQRGRWAEAEGAFKAFLDANPSDARASSAAYWLAETYYFRKEYGDAAAAFARNYRGYGPEAPKAADNLLKLGMSLAALGQKENACQTFAELAKRHPNASVPVRQTLARERAAAACA